MSNEGNLDDVISQEVDVDGDSIHVSNTINYNGILKESEDMSEKKNVAAFTSIKGDNAQRNSTLFQRTDQSPIKKKRCLRPPQFKSSTIHGTDHPNIPSPRRSSSCGPAHKESSQDDSSMEVVFIPPHQEVAL